MKKILLFNFVLLALFTSCEDTNPNGYLQPPPPRVSVWNHSGDAFIEIAENPKGEYSKFPVGASFEFWPSSLSTYTFSIVERDVTVYKQVGSDMVETIKGKSSYSFTVTLEKPVVAIQIYGTYIKVTQRDNYDSEAEFTTQIITR